MSRTAAIAISGWLALLSGCPGLPLSNDGGAAGSGGGCVDTQLCVRGRHWDPVKCSCVVDAPDASAPADAGATTCVDNVLCVRGDHWDGQACACVPDSAAGSGGQSAGASGAAGTSAAGGGDELDAGATCVDTALCAVGAHWDERACHCVSDAANSGGAGASGVGASGAGGAAGAACVENQACAHGAHWDSSACKCVKDVGEACGATTCDAGEHCCEVAASSGGSCVSRCETVCPTHSCEPPTDAGASDACRTASDCHGPLPQLCMLCASSDGGSACAHWACRQSQCSIAICD